MIEASAIFTSIPPKSTILCNLCADWNCQAEADLRHALNALEDSDYEWSCFAPHLTLSDTY